MALRPCYLPPKFLIDCVLERNHIRQLQYPGIEVEADVIPFTRGKRQGELVLLGGRRVMSFAKQLAFQDEMSGEVLITADGRMPSTANSKCKWTASSSSSGCVQVYDKDKLQANAAAVLRSWDGQFRFVEERILENGEVLHGLRPPQIGGLHSAIGHWKMSDAVATIVMPTGTGKTETMIALALHERPARLLVIVPSDSLRAQISEKFVILGLLRQLGICGDSALYPVVGTLQSGFASREIFQNFLTSCNVVISTMSLLSRLSEEDRHVCAGTFTHLFIDEAHHIKARTWERFRDAFVGKRILQFTATPFRNDGAHVDGRVLFNYPLMRAQSEGYFRPINLLPITEFDPDLSDEMLARAAVNQLKKDLAAGFDHILMARTSTIPKAATLSKLYGEMAKDFNPVLIHSEVPELARQDRLNQLKSRHARIVVCVDMFGEGFDFPELKIAAMHSIHKSLAITLQFTGRFTRTKGTIGDATVVVNIYDSAVDDALKELYAEDANWNHILRRLSEGATGKQVEKQEFIESFSQDTENIPVQNLTPKMSTVVYRTQCSQWAPQRLFDFIPREKLIGSIVINSAKNVAYFVFREENEVEWGTVKGLVDRAYDLYVLFWDSQRKLLFINTSNNDAVHEVFAKATAGDTAELIKGSQVFRVFGGLTRLLLQTLGLSHTISRVIRFTMHVGLDVPAGLADAQTQNKVKTNIFGSGFSEGEHVTIGCSRKGRIWSRQTAADLLSWIDWCGKIGAKLQNRTFSEEDILKNSIVPMEIETRPDLMPLAIEWPDGFYLRAEDATTIYINDLEYDFDQVGMELVNPDRSGPIKFRVFTNDHTAVYDVNFSKTGASYTPVSGAGISIGVGRRRRPLPDWFRQEAPIIRFEQDSFTKDNQLCRPYQPRLAPFDATQILDWDWDNIDLKCESQTEAKLTHSIQYRVIQRIKEASWPDRYDVLFDDDGTNEAADVIGIRAGKDELLLHLFHCKYSKGASPGARVEDLYEVCGQAQRSVQWRAHIDRLLSHLITRDVAYVKRTDQSRFEAGDRKTVFRLRKQAPYLKIRCEVYIVQPGISKRQISARQLELLGATETYLMDQYQMRLHVISSP